MNLKSILKPVSIEHKLVEKEIGQQIAGILSRHTGESWSEGYVTKVLQHVFNIPGKMLRPALFLLSAKSVSPLTNNFEKHKDSLIQLAAGIELLHTASLIHDDIIDESENRRSQNSLNAEYGVKIAVLVGDILFAQFFSIVLNLPLKDWEIKNQLLSLFSNLTQAMCFGEVFQQKLLSLRKDADFKEYLLILEKKTALLMEASCRSGAIIAGGSEKEINAFTEFGLNFGYAFQLADDIADEDAVYSKMSDIAIEGQSRINSAKKSLISFKENSSIKSLYSLCDYLKIE
ncbi:MAG: polyprenyl synthetase family protein [Spirochaetaceae bacterium]|nr:polyprenyl synthetase family protein [Spirochaetaceae bacterium]